MRLWHLTFATDDRLPLFAEDRERLRCIRVVGRVAGHRLVLFVLVDDHLHLVLVCTEAELGRSRRALWQALCPIVRRPMAPPRTRPIEGRHHLQNTVGYLLTQPDHHGIAVHPALWSGSCFQDLVGARCMKGMELALFDLLPRLHVAELCMTVGIELPALATAPEVRAAGAQGLVTATLSALGLTRADTAPRGEIARARNAAAWLGRRAGMARTELAWALDVSARTLRRLAAQVPDLPVQRAVRLQIALPGAVEGGVRKGEGMSRSGAPARAKGRGYAVAKG